MASRVAAGLLHALGCPELCTASLKEYVELAVDLATNEEKYGRIRRKVCENRHKMPLFDTVRWVRYFENACQEMWKKVEKEEPPSYFDVLECGSIQHNDMHTTSAAEDAILTPGSEMRGSGETRGEEQSLASRPDASFDSGMNRREKKKETGRKENIPVATTSTTQELGAATIGHSHRGQRRRRGVQTEDAEKGNEKGEGKGVGSIRQRALAEKRAGASQLAHSAKQEVSNGKAHKVEGRKRSQRAAANEGDEAVRGKAGIRQSDKVESGPRNGGAPPRPSRSNESERKAKKLRHSSRR
uniref:O-GlcNAc transferase C-terminal domain-containing protein n=1 Tax=Palpitomonas bilix TaxID=652834 RepID=A0A7S3CVK6_9EUKA